MKKGRCLPVLLMAGLFVCAGRLEAQVLVSRQDAPSSGSRLVGGRASAGETAVEETAAGEAAAGATEVLQVEVIALEGDAQVKPANQASFGAAQEGALLESGTTIKTGRGSYVELGFDEGDQNVVRVEEGTTAVLLLQEEEKVELLEGEVFSIIRSLPAGAAFEIRTPTAVAGARGTEWATRYQEGTTDVESYDETPYVKSFDRQGQVIGEAVPVRPGFATSVGRFQPPAAARHIPEARRQHWAQTKEKMHQRLQRVRQERGRPVRDPHKVRHVKADPDRQGPPMERERGHIQEGAKDRLDPGLQKDRGRLQDQRQKAQDGPVERPRLQDTIEEGDAAARPKGPVEHLGEPKQDNKAPVKAFPEKAGAQDAGPAPQKPKKDAPQKVGQDSVQKVKHDAPQKMKQGAPQGTQQDLRRSTPQAGRSAVPVRRK